MLAYACCIIDDALNNYEKSLALHPSPLRGAPLSPLRGAFTNVGRASRASLFTACFEDAYCLIGDALKGLFKKCKQTKFARFTSIHNS